MRVWKTSSVKMLNLLTPAGEPCLAFQKVAELPPATWPDTGVPQQLHLDLTVRSVEELKAVHSRIVSLGGRLRFDRSDSIEEPLRVYVDRDGHQFCVFVVAENETARVGGPTPQFCYQALATRLSRVDSLRRPDAPGLIPDTGG